MRTAWALLFFAASAAEAAITGTIITEEGKPIAGATVQAFAAESSQALRARLLSSSPERTPLTIVQSTGNGSFSIDPKSPLADIAVVVDDRLVAGLELADGEDAGVLVVPAQASRRLRVLADGKPLPKALVAAGPFTLRTNASGNVDLPEMSSVVARVTVLQRDFAIQDDFVGESSSARTNITLTKGTAIHGKVVARDGSAVEHALISIAGWPLAESDSAGEFTIAHAPPNWRAIVATGNDSSGVAMRKPGAITIHLAPAASISGVLRDVTSGRGVAAARVMVIQPSDSPGESVISDANGRFTVTPLVAGRYAISATHPAYAITQTEIAAQKSASATVEARPLARISGNVIDERRAPVPGALVWFGMRVVARGGAVVTGPGGEFTLRANFSSSFPQSVIAVKSGYAAGISGPLNQESTKSRLTITLPRGFPLAVKVVDKQHQPVSGAMVLLLSASADAVGRNPVVCEHALSGDCHFTDTSGSANYRVTEGSYAVQVRGETVATKMLPAQTLTARSSPLTIEVDQAAEVSGRVVYRDGTAVTDAIVMARNGIPGSARTDPDGTFTLRGLTAGPITLVARFLNTGGTEAAAKDVTAPARDVVITLPMPARIEGRVFAKDTHQPVTDFRVAATQRDLRFGGAISRPQEFHSDDGTFTLERAPIGTITVRVAASGYAPATLNDITVEEGKSVTGLEIALERGGRIIGRVTANDQPVSGASVRFASQSFGGPFDPNSTTTDADGAYVIDSVAAGDRTIEFIKQGYVPKRKSIEVAAGKDARLDVELDRGRDLSGRVVDSSGQPVSGARIMETSGGRIPNVFSDTDGLFKIEGLAAGYHTIRAEKAGYVNATADADVPTAAPLILTLKSGATITGRVVGLTDSDLSITTVYASGSGSNARAQVEAGGAFTLRGVPDGKVMVWAMVPGAQARQSERKTVEVTEGAAPAVEIDFSQGVTITGRVTQNGSVVSGGNVNFSPKKRVSTGGSSQINSDGSYAVSGLPSGDFNVRVFTYGGVQYQTDYSVAGNATFDIDIKGATLHGRVVDASTGDPVADGRVWIEPTKDVKVSQNTTTDSQGKFVMNALPDGTITLRATREQFAPVTQSVVVASGTAPDVELRLDRGQEATVRIVDAQSGNPINGYVWVWSGRKNVASAAPGDDGVMRVWLASGTYKASVSAQSYVTSNVDLIVPGPELRVPLTRGGNLLITSRGGGDVRISLAGLPLETSGAGGIVTAKRMMRLSAGVQANSGTLPPGRYSVELLATDRVTVKQSYSVDIVAGQTAQVNID